MFSIQTFSSPIPIQSIETVEKEETRKSLRDLELRVAKSVHNGFITRDQQDRLKVSSQELLDIRKSSVQLLGGWQRHIFKGDVTLKSGESFSSETNKREGYYVYIDTFKETVQATVLFDGTVMYNGSLTGCHKWDHHRHGHYQVTIVNKELTTKTIFVHVMEQYDDDCIIA